MNKKEDMEKRMEENTKISMKCYDKGYAKGFREGLSYKSEDIIEIDSDKLSMAFLILMQSIMNLILILDLFSLRDIGLDWVNILILVLWNISCSLVFGLLVLKIKEGNEELNKKRE